MIKTSRFYFKRKWMGHESFKGLLHHKWLEFVSKANDKVYSLDKWTSCVAMLRSFLRGWGANLNGEYKRKKTILLDQLRNLDSLAELHGLNSEEWSHRYSIEADLEQTYAMEENHWHQRSGLDWITK